MQAHSQETQTKQKEENQATHEFTLSELEDIHINQSWEMQAV